MKTDRLERIINHCKEIDKEINNNNPDDNWHLAVRDMLLSEYASEGVDVQSVCDKASVLEDNQ